MAYSAVVDDHTSDVLVEYQCGHTGAVRSPGVADPAGLLRNLVTKGNPEIKLSDIVGYAKWPHLCPECSCK